MKLLIVYVCLAWGMLCSVVHGAEWSDVKLTEKSSVQAYLKEYPQGDNADNAKQALMLHDIISQIKAGKVTPQFSIAMADIDKRFVINEYTPISAPFVMGIKHERKNVEKEEGIMFGGFYHRMELAISLGLVKDGHTESLHSMHVLGQKTYIVNQGPFGDPLIFPAMPGSIIAIQSIGTGFNIMDKVSLSTQGNTVYFSVVDNIGFTHIYGQGTLTMKNGSVIKLK